MTYNFDPERWLEIQRNALERRRQSGEIDQEEFLLLEQELLIRYEEMLKRLDIRHDYSEE